MRFRFPSDTASRSLSRLHYRLLIVDCLANLTSLFWLGVLWWYLRFWERLEYGPILYGVAALLVASLVAAVPYCFLASRCLLGPWENPIGPVSMLLGGHAAWQRQWQASVVDPNEQLSVLAGETRAAIAQIAASAKEERLQREDLAYAAQLQQQLLLQLHAAIPSDWQYGSLFYGEIRHEVSPPFSSESIDETARRSLANVVLRVFSVFDHVLVYRNGPAHLMLLFDRRDGEKDTKVRVSLGLEQLGGSYQWRIHCTQCYVYLPGYRRTPDGLVPSRGDVEDVRRILLGDPLTAPFRVGLLSLVNPLNLFRFVNLFHGLWFRAERDWRASSQWYLENHFLGHGDFTDLALIGKHRHQVLRKGKEYQGPPITLPDEATKKCTEQFTGTILQVILAAIRDVVDPGALDGGVSPLLHSNSDA